jgi:polyisoprenoid-binding protein YceI
MTTAVSTWTIDPARSAAEFKVRHMMISYVKGKFSGLCGILKLNENDYTHSTVEVSIPAARVGTVDDKLDAHLNGADFFDVEKFPTLTFESTSIHSVGGRDYASQLFARFRRNHCVSWRHSTHRSGLDHRRNR